MSTNSIIQAKQQRSQNTQDRLLGALNLCLQSKYFEHISIKELAEQANVSVGTFYRRFKNKESLLPLLYQDFGQDLEKWVIKMESRSYMSTIDLVETLCRETYLFLNSRKSVFRTLHLNARLYSLLLASDNSVNRQVIYKRLIDLVLQFEDELKGQDPQKKAGVAIYTMINTLLDKVLYPDLTPATACDLQPEDFSEELPAMLLAYLVSDDIK